MRKRIVEPPHLPPDRIPSPGVLVHLSHAYHACQSSFEQMTGMPLTKWRILYLLTRVGNCTQKYMSEVTRVDAGSITRVVKALDSEGLVRRAADPEDNRLTRVELTRAGERLVEQVIERRKRFVEKMVRGISATELARLNRILNRIEDNLADPAG